MVPPSGLDLGIGAFRVLRAFWVLRVFVVIRALRVLRASRVLGFFLGSGCRALWVWFFRVLEDTSGFAI